jgi:hypothetical protein
MYYEWLNGFPEHSNANSLSPSFKLCQGNGEFLLELLLFIPGDAINLSLQRDSDLLLICQAPCCGFCPRIGERNIKLHSLVGGHVCRPESHIFGSSIIKDTFFVEVASKTSSLCTNFHQWLSLMMLESFFEKLVLSWCHLRDFALQIHYCHLLISI